MARRKAYPDMGSGVNPNTAVRIYDTHPNRRIAVGEEVVMIDHEQPNVRGLVLGYCAEDRLWVKWPTVVAQEDVDDVIATGELGNVVSLRDTGVVVRPQSVHTPGAFPKKTASKKTSARPHEVDHKDGHNDEDSYPVDHTTDFYTASGTPGSYKQYGVVDKSSPDGHIVFRSADDGKMWEFDWPNPATPVEGRESSRRAGKRGARFSFKKVRKGGGHAFDVYVDDQPVGTIRQTVKSGKRLWKVQGRKREKLFATRKEAAEALCARKKCANPEVVDLHKKAHLTRKDGVRGLDDAVKALVKAGRKREAKITARLARTAMIFHLMHYVPSTRREASRDITKKLFKTRVRLALSMTKSLRKNKKFTRIADHIEVALAKAFTYPKKALRVAAIQTPPPAFSMVFGAGAYQAWDEVLRRAQQQGIDPMMASYEDVTHIMGQVQQEMMGAGVQAPQVPISQADPNTMGPNMYNAWFQQQQSIGNPRVPSAPQGTGTYGR